MIDYHECYYCGTADGECAEILDDGRVVCSVTGREISDDEVAE